MATIRHLSPGYIRIGQLLFLSLAVFLGWSFMSSPTSVIDETHTIFKKPTSTIPLKNHNNLQVGSLEPVICGTALRVLENIHAGSASTRPYCPCHIFIRALHCHTAEYAQPAASILFPSAILAPNPSRNHHWL